LIGNGMAGMWTIDDSIIDDMPWYSDNHILLHKKKALSNI
jgi:hypothetical protein